MTGANGLKKACLRRYPLNLDSEDEGELCVGCAGGVNVAAGKEYGQEKPPLGMTAFRVIAKGLKGGHSGVDIALGRANSNKIMFRFLMQAESDFGIRVAEAAGGDLRNAIPRESYSVVLVPEIKEGQFRKFVRAARRFTGQNF
jgi:dipeptidase D